MDLFIYILSLIAFMVLGAAFSKYLSKVQVIETEAPAQLEEPEDNMKITLNQEELESAVKEYLENRGFSVDYIELEYDDEYSATVDLSEPPKVPSPYRG